MSSASRSSAATPTAQARLPAADRAITQSRSVLQAAADNLRALHPLQQRADASATSTALAHWQSKADHRPGAAPSESKAPRQGASGKAQGSYAPVQRRVGFEFQTNLLLRDGNDKSAPLKTPLYRGNGWHIECDAGDLEFVTKPFTVYDEVGPTLAEITQWAGRMRAIAASLPKEYQQRFETLRSMAAEFRQDEDEVSAKDYEQLAEDTKRDNQRRPLGAMREHEGTALANLFAVGEATALTAAPQTTVGVPLDRIISAMHLVAAREISLGADTASPKTVGLAQATDDAAPTMISAHDATVRWVNTLREKHPTVAEKSWRSLEGLLSLTASYVRTAQPSSRSTYAYAKQIAPLMSRVNFGAVFEQLPAEVQDFFTGTSLAQASGVDKDGLVFGPKGVKKGVPGPTLSQWVTSIRQGQDALSVYGVHAATDHIMDGSESMGAFKHLDTGDAVHRQPLVPLELRRMSKRVPVEHWTALAQEVFLFSEALLKAKFY